MMPLLTQQVTLLHRLRVARQFAHVDLQADNLSQAQMEAAGHAKFARELERELADLALVQLAAEEAGGIIFNGAQELPAGAGKRKLWCFTLADASGTTFTIPAGMIPTAGILADTRKRLTTQEATV